MHFIRAIAVFNLLISTVLGVSVGGITSHVATKDQEGVVQWVHMASPSEAISLHPYPAGLENGVKLYICRSKIGGYVQAGKFVTLDGQIYCSVGLLDSVHNQTDFEMLDAPEGSTSWVAIDNELPLPSNAIVAGNTAYDGIAHVCRAWKDDNLIVGTCADATVCYFPQGEIEHEYRSTFEVLVLNDYGLALQLQGKKKA